MILEEWYHVKEIPLYCFKTFAHFILFYYILFYFFAMLGIGPRVLHILAEHPITELRAQKSPLILCLFLKRFLV